MTDQVGNKLLSLMQALAVQQGTSKPASKTADAAEPNEFQKQLEKFQKDQSTSKGSSDAKDNAATDTTKTETSEKPVAEETVQTPKDEKAELQERMMLAAMATLQAPVVVTETPEPPAEMVETLATVVLDGNLITEEFAESGQVKTNLEVPQGEVLSTLVETTAPQEMETQPQQENQNMVQTELEQPQENVLTTERPQTEDVQMEDQPVTERADTTELPKQQDSGEDVEVADVEQAPQTLFQDVKAAPIKVGEAAPAEQSEETQDVSGQLTEPLMKALEKGESRVEISLTPEALGNVRVEITRSEDGSLHVALSAETMQTRNLLEKHVGNLQNLLVDRNQGAVQVEVQRQQESQQNQNQQQNPDGNPYDGRNGHGQHGQQQEQRRGQQNSEGGEDFLQQLRLGLIPTDEG